MINAVFYCSYKGSPVGYQMAFADMKRKSLAPGSDNMRLIPRSVITYFSRGGANSVCGYDEKSREYFILTKRIEPENDENKFDEMGRKVFINIAFISEDKSELEQFCKGFFSCYNGVKKASARLLILEDNEFGYNVDFGLLASFIDGCLTAGKQSARSEFAVTFSPSTSISFVALESSWNYFAKMCNIPAYSTQAKQMSIEQFRAALALSSDTLPVKLPDEKTNVQANPEPPVIIIPEKKKIEKDKPPVDDGGEIKEIKEIKVQLDALKNNERFFISQFADINNKLTLMEDRLSSVSEKLSSKISGVKRSMLSAWVIAICSAIIAIVSLIICITK